MMCLNSYGVFLVAVCGCWLWHVDGYWWKWSFGCLRGGSGDMVICVVGGGWIWSGRAALGPGVLYEKAGERSGC